ncbi:glycerophosphodiester phosphodiesterase 1 [Rhineura floridana]|uniref:glycerophosphodiester phosphodiesterase 1 n=1 Tax=Rhineura floridana TaxID=261503 RepID=UPI002AC83B0D|nr:glycerophosphodiester phosphodiesterase 1 [Rhineura floridana]
MFCYPDGLGAAFSALLVAALALTRSAAVSCLLTGGLYLVLRLLSLEPVAPQRAQLVVQPRGNSSRIAHRGGAHDAPENTLAAIRQAADNGATGVELDLEFTADGIPILMHDDTVDRTTDGSGSLRDLTFAEIRKFNPAAKHRLWHPDKPVFGLFPSGTGAEEEWSKNFSAARISTLLMKRADRNVITALTHRPWSFSHFGDGTPRFESYWKHHFMMVLDVIMDWSMHNFLWHLCGASVFLVQKNFVSQEYVKQWSSKGVQVVAWTVNTLAEKMYYENVLQASYITDSLLEDCDPHF